jgi:hypothetical protein
MGFPAFALFDPQLPTAHPAQEAKIETTLAEAQRLVQEEQFSQALRVILEVCFLPLRVMPNLLLASFEQVTKPCSSNKAVNMCPCEPAGEGKQRHAKDKSCHIAQCMGAVNSDEPFALYEVAQGLCTCGYRWPSCGRQLHAKALDALADCLDKAEQYVAAFATALAIIRLDPASAVVSIMGIRRRGRLLLTDGLTRSDRGTAVVPESSGTSSSLPPRTLVPLGVAPWLSFLTDMPARPLLSSSELSSAASSRLACASQTATAAVQKTLSMWGAQSQSHLTHGTGPLIGSIRLFCGAWPIISSAIQP